jgi:peptidoglycan-N-acetylglucosamine deacetylase
VLQFITKMKQLNHILTIGIIAYLLPLSLLAQNIAPKYEVATWKGFTKAAVTYTFDDNTPKQYNVGIPMFNEFNLHATFYPVINWDPNWDAFREAAIMGHEIASHTVAHRNFNDLSEQEQRDELKNSQEMIRSKIEVEKCLTHAYPFCVPSIEEIVSEYYIGARHCYGQIEKATPDNFFLINAVMVGSIYNIKTAEALIEKANEAVKKGGWCTYVFHGIENDGGYSPVDSLELRKSLQHFDNNRNTYWVATFADVVRYIKQRDAVSIAEKKAGKTSIKVEISHSLNPSIYNTTLSIRRELPGNWQNARVLQGKKAMNSKLVQIEGKTYIEFSATPNAGEVTIEKQKA